MNVAGQSEVLLSKVGSGNRCQGRRVTISIRATITFTTERRSMAGHAPIATIGTMGNDGKESRREIMVPGSRSCNSLCGASKGGFTHRCLALIVVQLSKKIILTNSMISIQLLNSQMQILNWISCKIYSF